MYPPNTTLNISPTLQQFLCTNSGYIPTSRQFFQDLTQTERVMIWMCYVLTLITVGIYIEHVQYILHLKNHWLDLRSSVWILSVMPVTSLGSTLTLCLPRLAMVFDLISSLAVAVAVLHVKLEVMDHFGDVSTIMQALKSVRIPLSTSPFCFFRWCFPSFHVTRFRYGLMSCCVLQAAIVQPLTTLLSLAMFMEDKYLYRQMAVSSPDFQFVLIRCVSTLLGIYALRLAVAATEPIWKPLDLAPKCAILITWLSLINIQDLVFGLLVMHGIPACTGHLSSRVRGKGITNMLLLMEMMIMTVLARYSYNNLDLNSMEQDQFMDIKNQGAQYTSDIGNRKQSTDSFETGNDVCASPGLTDSSLFLSDSSVESVPEEGCQAKRTVVTNYGAITGNTLSCDLHSSQTDQQAVPCEHVNISVQQTANKQE